MSKETHRGTTGRFKRWEWGKQIKESQPAYAWGRFITPLYGIKVVGFLAGVTYSVRAPAAIQIPLLTSKLDLLLLQQHMWMWHLHM